jgi:hypothetical protein
MRNWIVSALLIFAMSGQMLAGVCGCEDGHNEKHSCCKPDKSGNTAMSAPGCCSADCESITTTKTPVKKNAEVAQSGKPSPRLPVVEIAVTWPTFAENYRPLTPKRPTGHRLGRARPSPLFIQHNSFLI